MVPILSRGDELIDLTDVPLYLIVCFQYGGFKLPFIVVGVLVLAVLPIMFFALEKDRRECSIPCPWDQNTSIFIIKNSIKTPFIKICHICSRLNGLTSLQMNTLYPQNYEKHVEVWGLFC